MQQTPARPGLVAGLLRFVVRLVLLAAGLVFAASVLVAALLLAAFWLVRAAWARLSGRPVAPWVMRVDPRRGFDRVYRGGTMRGAADRRAARAHADVTDVDPKERP